MKKVKKLKLKESVKDVIVIVIGLIVMTIAITLLQDRVEEIENNDKTQGNTSITILVNRN